MNIIFTSKNDGGKKQLKNRPFALYGCFFAYCRRPFRK